MGRNHERRRTGEGVELAVEKRRAVLVERGVGLVEDEQVGLVEERPAEREPLGHAARVRRDALVTRLPEPEALEEHPDALAPFGHAVEPAEEIEVLDRGELPVDEGLVRQIADARAVGVDDEIAARRNGETGERFGAASSSRFRSAP